MNRVASRRALLGRALALAGLAGASGALSRAPRDPLPSTDLSARARDLLVTLHATPLVPFLADWPAPAPPRPITPSAIPALRWLPGAGAPLPAFSAALLRALGAAAPSLAWRRSYTPQTVGASFYENYGYTEFAGLDGPTPSERLACGVLILGPHLGYPPHHHEADEIYVPLRGTAAWRDGGGLWRDEAPGAVIHHARDESHAMRTGAEPLIALYLWRSANLAQHSLLDAAPTG